MLTLFTSQLLQEPTLLVNPTSLTGTFYTLQGTQTPQPPKEGYAITPEGTLVLFKFAASTLDSTQTTLDSTQLTLDGEQ